jgi:hypothetical protein
MVEKQVYTSFTKQELKEIDKAVEVLNRRRRGKKFSRSDLIREGVFRKIDEITETYPEEF